MKTSLESSVCTSLIAPTEEAAVVAGLTCLTETGAVFVDGCLMAGSGAFWRWFDRALLV